MENWPKLLFTYGPFGLLFLFVFVIEQKSRAALTNTGIPRRISVTVYLLNWFAIFVLCVAIVYFWAQLNFPHETTIFGTLENLKANESFYSDADDLWLQRNYRSPGSYQWRLIASAKIPDGTKESFTIQLPNDRAFKYDLPVRSSFYASRVRLRYDRNTEKLLVDHAGTHEELAPSEELSSSNTESRPADLVPVVYAQSSVSLDEIFDRLESDDPIVRRDARRDLAAQGSNGLPRIERVLQDERASYRLQLGALVALNLIQGVTVSEKTKAGINALYQKYKCDPGQTDQEARCDPVIASEAQRFLHNLPAPTCGVRCGVERWAVKSLTDRDASKIDLTPQETTISQLITLDRPGGLLPMDSRVAPVELHTYRVKGILIRYMVEAHHNGDHDFHIVIADPNNHGATMIVEIPDPQCSNVCESAQVGRINDARETFDANFAPTPLFQQPGKLVQLTVTGVGFFDFFHNQMGMAPNGIELHPVLGVEVDH